MQLQKRIPIGAGLAGGSSNGAAALVGLNVLWGLGLRVDELQGLAAELGSDMPFCLAGGAQLCFGRGEQLERLDPQPADPLGVLLIKHATSSVSTPWAYGRCRALRSDFYLSTEAEFGQRREALRQSPLLAALRRQAPFAPLRNDLQSVVAPELPPVRDGLELLQRCHGAHAVAMSGSGPTLFALFGSRDEAAAAAALLTPALEQGGFDHWVCSTIATGAQLEP
jgi:4-diphosphocytidyl-2-C-methyl-D-erythritol kinase